MTAAWVASVAGLFRPALTPLPGALCWRHADLAAAGGTLPGVIAGSVIRVYVLPGPVVFDFVVAAVLLTLGTWLAQAPANHAATAGRARLPRLVTGLIAAVAGCVGGIYGIGGGSILAPILIADGQPASQGRARRAHLDLRHLARWRGDVLPPVDQPPWQHRAGLAHRDRAGNRQVRDKMP